MKYIFLVASILVIAATCNRDSPSSDPGQVPQWAKEAIWYQVFVERFRNGDPSNDPQIKDLYGSFPGNFPASWKITPWGHDWYSHESWLDSVVADGFYSKIQARRYGGDLEGVFEKLDYLSDLGITAIYFNPLNDAPSLHKYDAANYTHIDHNFGPDPDGDIEIMQSEVPDDPSTWLFTSADSLFLKIVKECHNRGIRVIMDYSWNHTGPMFWALQDIKKKGKRSKFADWYNIISFDDTTTAENEFKYEGWGGNNPWMPVFRKDIVPPDDSIMPFEGNFHSPSLREHIFNVSRRWLDPDADGNTSDGVDGFRLDVAGEIPMGFWREYRKVVRSVNPQAYLVGEIWWLEWPDKFLNPADFLRGDQFDAVMNYRWYRIARGFFVHGAPVLKPSGFVKEMNRINSGISDDNLKAMMNVTATHDAPRLSTDIYNKKLYKYKVKPSEDPDYKINKPDELTRREQMFLLLHQFTFEGAPHIWNGDEMGMWGADDPDCRKPLIWGDLTFEPEKANFYPGKPRPVDQVRQDTGLISYYKKIIKLRKENPVLMNGNTEFIVADDKKNVLAYSRKNRDSEIIAVFNRSDSAQNIRIHGISKFVPVFSTGEFTSSGDELNLEPLTGVVIKKAE
jgi:glycosidase